MTNLSPAAQAILDAINKELDEAPWNLTFIAAPAAAAALRAAADQVVPQSEIAPQQDLESRREAMEWGMKQQTQLTRHQILAIAIELDGDAR